MDDVSRHRRPSGFGAARQAVALALAAALVVSCSAPESPDRETEPGRTVSESASPAPTSTPDEALERLPKVPASRDADALADQLDTAVETLRDRDATATDVRLAAEFQQLAVRTLARASSGFRRKVLDELHPETALVTQGDVRAARLLHSLNRPQTRMPRWRIVAPPPVTELLGYYKQAQRRTGVPWTYLAAIHLVETRMGRIRGTSTAGALGPMQFLPPTWDLYGAGGDINDPRDAILAAARLLKDNGAPGDMAEALWHYNPADEYVGAVTAYARTMQRSRSAYRGYWHWRVLFSHRRGTYVLPIGYPDTRAVRLPDNAPRPAPG